MKDQLKNIVDNSFLSHYGFRRYFANTSWLMAEKILRLTVGLFVGVYVARYLGPERFGILSYAMSVVALFSVFSTLGLDGILVRELIKSPERQNELLGTAFILKLAGTGLALLLLSVILYITGISGQDGSIILIIAVGLIFQSFNVIQFYFEANVLAKFVAVSQIVSWVAISIIKVVFVLLRLPLVYFAWLIILESLIVAIGLSIIYCRNDFRILRWTFGFKTATALLKNCWPLILSGIAVTLYMKIDQVMIRNMLNAEAVGQYAAAVRLSEALYFVPTVIIASLFPAMVNAKKTSEELYRQRLMRMFSLMVCISVPLSLFFTFFSRHIVTFLYGEEFLEAGLVLAIHIWASISVFLGIVSSKHLLVENFMKISFLRVLIGGFSNLLLNCILIPRYGIKGAAIATGLSYTFAVFFVILIPKTREHGFMMLRSFNPFFKNTRIQ